MHFVFLRLKTFLLEREREKERVREHEQGRGVEGKRENLEQAPCSVRSPAWGSNPHHDLSQSQEPDAQLIEPPWRRVHFVFYNLQIFLYIGKKQHIFILYIKKKNQNGEAIQIYFYFLFKLQLVNNETFSLCLSLVL